MSRPLFIRGMHGLGDNLHQRAVVRALMAERELWLETPWPSVYHDLVGDRLRLVSKGSALRTQAKNARRQAALFDAARPPSGIETLQVLYRPDDVRARGGVLQAMMMACRVPQASRDFRLPLPAAWLQRAEQLIAGWGVGDRPVLIYRPLVERSEWSGCAARNPDHAAYAAIGEALRDRFFVVSLADLEPGKEWLAGAPLQADVTLHAGELVFEDLAAVMALADLVLSSPGFAVVLAQAVGTPSVCVVGGYEDGTSFSAGAAFTPHLSLQPTNPCPCFRHDHGCDKRMDLPAALAALETFVDGLEDRPRA